MEFEWDEGKRQSNLQKHNVDFEDIKPVFEQDNQTIQSIDNRQDYGEIRIKILGEIQGKVYCVIYTKRNSKYRIISARRANSRETRKYYQSLLGRMGTDEG
jgi:hypothetical protein